MLDIGLFSLFIEVNEYKSDCFLFVGGRYVELPNSS